MASAPEAKARITLGACTAVKPEATEAAAVARAVIEKLVSVRVVEPLVIARLNVVVTLCPGATSWTVGVNTSARSAACAWAGLPVKV